MLVPVHSPSIGGELQCFDSATFAFLGPVVPFSLPLVVVWLVVGDFPCVFCFFSLILSDGPPSITKFGYGVRE